MPIQTPFDGAQRRRIHLMRHAEAAYRGSDGNAHDNPNVVPLTSRGRKQAQAMHQAIGALSFDYALCTPFPRTSETARIVLGDRNLSLQVEPRLQEIQASREGMGRFSPADLAYSFDRAKEAGARFAGGENIGDFCARVHEGFEAQITETAWKSALFVCHGGVNRAILTWVLGTGPELLSAFEQDNACMNIIDIDCDPETGMVVRRYVRLINWTPYDPSKSEIHLTTMEATAVALEQGHTAEEETGATD
ncbi:histidine phosphatase family protein [Myxococcota bacterium]|nr:histidine phosphatase family protein [Myxococcota bacterium]